MADLPGRHQGRLAGGLLALAISNQLAISRQGVDTCSTPSSPAA
ncbi:hypothetical protein [Nannocystis exedens]|nr:hypothetical protein [Nannocystis exedens]